MKNIKKIKNKFIKLFKNIIKDKKKLVILISFILVSILFFLYPLILSYDGSEYYYFTSFFDGTSKIYDRIVIRGFVFPTFIYIFKHLFGDTNKGILVGFYLFYILFMTISYVFLNKNCKNKKMFTILYLALLLFNMLIFGYSHTLLTEGVMISIILIALLLTLKWSDINFKDNKKYSIIYTLLLSISLIFCWFLKKRYAILMIIIYFTNIIVKSIYNKSFKLFIEKFIELIIMFILLFVCIKINNMTLNKIDDSYAEKSSIKQDATNGLTLGIRANYTLVEYSNVNYLRAITYENATIDDVDDAIENDYPMALYTYNGKYILFINKYGVRSNAIFLIEQLFAHPYAIISGYIKNYFTSINITIESSNIRPSYENRNLGMFIFNKNNHICWYKDESTVVDLDQDFIQYSEKICNERNNNSFINNILYIINPTYLLVFFLTNISAILLVIFTGIKLFKYKDKRYLTPFIIFTITLLYNLFYSAMGTVIDRYIFSYYPCTLIGIILLIDNLTSKE